MLLIVAAQNGMLRAQLAPALPHCERSEAIYRVPGSLYRLPRHFVARNDGDPFANARETQYNAPTCSALVQLMRSEYGYRTDFINH